jgi:predicted permease
MGLERLARVAALRLRTVLHRGKVDRELDKELRFHLEGLVEENIAVGMSERDARFAALRRFGGLTQIQETCREQRRTRLLEDFQQDLVYTLRSLRRTPGFTAVIVATLALSIGANSAIFSLFEGVLLRPLPYPDAGRLTRVFFNNSNWPKFPLNPFDFRDFRERNHSFESFAAYTRSDVQLSGQGEPIKLTGFMVTAGFFRTLGLRPALGSEFSTRNEVADSERVVILSDRIWRDRFGSAPDVIGRKITLQSQPFTVVGVMPPGAEHPGNSYNPVAYGETVDAWLPYWFEGNPNQRASHFMEGLGRLKPGVTLDQARADLTTVLAGLAAIHPGDRNWRIVMVPLHHEIVGTSRRILIVLLGAVGLVLLIACANAANLLLARATARQHEIALRMALGADRGRLIRQLLAESLLISFIGGALGAALSGAGVRLLVAALPAGFPRASEIHVDGVVLAFTLLISVATGLLFGIVPAMHAARNEPRQGLAESGRSFTGGASSARLRNILVIAEVSLSFVLLLGAGLMLRSLLNLLNSEPGFRPQHVLTAAISLPGTNYHGADAISRFYRRLLEDLSAVPGVQAAGAGSDLPWTGYDDNASGFKIENAQPPPHEEFHARYHCASPGYFRAVGTPLLRGRFFDDHDTKESSAVLIVNQAMATRYWPGGNAVGRRLTFEDAPKEKDWSTVVGIVADVKDRPDSAAAEPAFWWPHQQQPFGSMRVVVRSDMDTQTLARQLQLVVHRMDPALAVGDLRAMDAIADASYSTSRFSFFLVSLFALLAWTLASIGIYGVISYSVSLRLHEYAVRIALGASVWQVMRLVIGQGVRLAVAGTAIGLVCGFALARLLASVLYQVPGADPLTLASAVFVALASAALACYVPARRVVANDPMRALQTE